MDFPAEYGEAQRSNANFLEAKVPGFQEAMLTN